MRNTHLMARPVADYVKQSYKDIYLRLPDETKKELFRSFLSPSATIKCIEKLPPYLVPIGKKDIELEAAQALFSYMVYVEQPDKSREYMNSFEEAVKKTMPDLYKEKLLPIKKYREKPDLIEMDELLLLIKMRGRASLACMQEQIIKYRFGLTSCPVWEDAMLKKGVDRLYEKVSTMLRLPKEDLNRWLALFANSGFHEDNLDKRGDLSYCSTAKLQYYLAAGTIYEDVSEKIVLSESDVKVVVDNVFRGFITSYLIDINGEFEEAHKEAKESGSKAEKDFAAYQYSMEKDPLFSGKEKLMEFPNKNLIKGYIKKDDDQLVLEAVLNALVLLSLQARRKKALTAYIRDMSEKIVIKGDDKLSEVKGQNAAMAEEIKALKAENHAMKGRLDAYKKEKDALTDKIRRPLLAENEELRRKLKKEEANAREAERKYAALKEKLEKEQEKEKEPEQEAVTETGSSLEEIKGGRYIFMCDQFQVQTKLLSNFPASSIGSFMKLDHTRVKAADAMVIIATQISHREKIRGEAAAKNAGIPVVYCTNNNMDMIASTIRDVLVARKEGNKE